MNKYEVGFMPDDNNDRRLPGSVQPEPKRGNFAYDPENANPAKPTPLDAGDTGGVIGVAKIGLGYGMPSMNAEVDINGPKGEVETNYDHTNLSAKYKYPNVHQDIPSKSQPTTQYNDHT